MNFGNDSPDCNQADSLLFSPKKNENYNKYFEDLNYNIDHHRDLNYNIDHHRENFFSLNTFEQKHQIQNFSPPKQTFSEKLVKKTVKTSILKLDFLKELLKDDIELKNKKNQSKIFKFENYNIFNPIKKCYMEVNNILKNMKIFK